MKVLMFYKVCPHSVLNSLLFRVHQTWLESQFSHTVSKLWWYQINSGRYISILSLVQISQIYINRIQYLMSMFNEESRFHSPFDKRFPRSHWFLICAENVGGWKFAVGLANDWGMQSMIRGYHRKGSGNILQDFQHSCKTCLPWKGTIFF